MHHTKTYDIAIVGAGLAGLTAAIVAGRAGKSVLLLEKAPAPGGRASTRNAGGFLFNQGPHALYRGGQAAAILRDLGITYRGAKASYLGSWALLWNERFPLPGTPEQIVQSPMFSPEAAKELLGLLGSLPHEDLTKFNRTTVAEWLHSSVHTAEARSFLRALMRLATYCADTERQSAGAALEQLAISLAGVDYLDDGWQQLVDLLREEAVWCGAKLATRSGVESVEPDGNRVLIRTSDRTEFVARTAIITTAPAKAAQLIGASRVPSLARWAAEAVPIYAACLDIGLRRLPRAEHQFAIGIDRPLYYSVHTRSAKLAPDGGALIQVAKYLTNETTAGIEETERELEDLMDQLQPGWRDELATRHFLPRMLVTNAVVRAADGGMSGRPGPTIPELPNVFLAGDWVGPTGMLADASVASARDAATLACVHLDGASEKAADSRELASV